MIKGFNPETPREKQKTPGKEVLLRDLDRRSGELIDRKNRHWITNAEYNLEKEKLDEERLEVLTRPD